VNFIQTTSFPHLQSEVELLRKRHHGCTVMAALADHHIPDPELIDAKPYLANSVPQLAVAHYKRTFAGH